MALEIQQRVALHKDVKFKVFVISQNDWIVGKFKSYEGIAKWKKSIFEKLGGEYEQQENYLIPRLTVPAEEEHSIGIWGQRHLDYLKQCHKVTYTNLHINGKLSAYLATSIKL